MMLIHLRAQETPHTYTEVLIDPVTKQGYAILWVAQTPHIYVPIKADKDKPIKSVSDLEFFPRSDKPDKIQVLETLEEARDYLEAVAAADRATRGYPVDDPVDD